MFNGDFWYRTFWLSVAVSIGMFIGVGSAQNGTAVAQYESNEIVIHLHESGTIRCAGCDLELVYRPNVGAYEYRGLEGTPMAATSTPLPTNTPTGQIMEDYFAHFQLD